MASLWMTLEIAPGKQREFVDAMRRAVQSGPGGPTESSLYRSLEAPSRLCWNGRWESARALEAFLGSSAYRTVCGAARVLGTAHTLERGENCADPGAASGAAAGDER
jgi:quinol monooxygenase YgiN